LFVKLWTTADTFRHLGEEGVEQALAGIVAGGEVRFQPVAQRHQLIIFASMRRCSAREWKRDRCLLDQANIKGWLRRRWGSKRSNACMYRQGFQMIVSKVDPVRVRMKGRYWGNNGHSSALALNCYDANDPKMG
jgi:hypothetical protein